MFDKSFFRSLKNSRYVQKIRPSVVKMDELMGVIYAVNPKTGFASSDLSLMDNPNVRPEVARAIQALNRPVDVPDGVEDDDVAFDTLQRLDESDIAYADRMKNLSSKV